jgi:FkbM family methyltransferase
MQWVLNVLAWLCGNSFAQRLLNFNVLAAQYLMGIGAGSRVASSGEETIWRKLRASAKANQELCVFDVGANEGQFLEMIASGLGGVSFRVHAFEPSEKAFAILRQKAGAQPSVVLNNFALGREQGEAKLFYEKTGSGLGSLYKRRLDHFGIDFNQSATVSVQTLDQYCAKQGIQRIDLLKLDVEGYELQVLYGAQRMFSERRIGMVSFEFGGCNIDSRTFLQDFYYFFKERGMTISRITPSGYLWPIYNYREIDEQFRTTNFLVS